MSRMIYDNWERLVEATLKRDQCYQLCHAHSRTPSITSSLSSDFTFPSPASIASVHPSPLVIPIRVTRDLIQPDGQPTQSHFTIGVKDKRKNDLLNNTNHKKDEPPPKRFNRYRFNFSFSLKALRMRNLFRSQLSKPTESRSALLNYVPKDIAPFNASDLVMISNKAELAYSFRLDDEPITDYNIIIDALPAGTIGDLHEIAKRMVSAGYVKECSYAYSTCRREFLDESLSRLGLQKFSTDELQRMQWTQLGDESEKWMKAMNVALRTVFPCERRLCDRVFFGCSSAADLSFMEVSKGLMIQLLNFADAVAIRSRAPERLFTVLDVYETVRDLMPEFQLIFSNQYCLSLRNEAINICKRLGETNRGIFMELENLIRRDPAKAAVPGGGLHPITRYVINYLRAACLSRQTLEQVFEESVNVDYRKRDDNRALSSSSSLAVQMAWIMELLESNLEAKSKVYRYSALCSVFMMNNLRYIVQNVKDNELGALLGDDWIRKHTAKVRQYHVGYQRRSWSKILNVLKVDNNSIAPNGASKNLREKLKLFNSYFEEICKTQSSWIIIDEQLRDELRISISGTLSLAYGNFIGRLQIVPDRYIRYTVEDIEARVGELFQGIGDIKSRMKNDNGGYARSMDSSSYSSQSFGAVNEDSVFCDCGFKLSTQTSTTKKNHGRHFLSCPVRGECNCIYFRWTDSEVPLRPIQIIRDLEDHAQDVEGILNKYKQKYETIVCVTTISWIILLFVIVLLCMIISKDKKSPVSRLPLSYVHGSL